MTEHGTARRSVIACLLAWWTLGAAQVDIVGTVTDAAGDPIEGATVELLGETFRSTTDASGQYHLVNDATTIPRAAGSEPRALVVRGGKVTLSIARASRVAIAVFNTKGARIGKPVEGVLQAGSHSFPLQTAGTCHGVAIIRAKVGGQTTVMRNMALGSGSSGQTRVRAPASTLAKAAAAVDTIRASKTGYVTKSVPIERLADTVDIVLEEESTAGEYITTPEKHGLTNANDVAQVRSAFAAAIADASAHASQSSTSRGVVELVPGKVYTCMPSGNGPSVTDNAGAIIIDNSTPNVELRTKGKPTIASGDQAVLRMDKWSSYSNVRTRCILRIDVPKNVLVGWVELDGNKLSAGANAAERRVWLDSKVDYSKGGNGGLSNIVLYGGDGVTLKEVNSHDALVDGLYLRRSGGAETGTISGLAEGCIFSDCRRQGLTFITAGRSTGTWDQFTFRGCKFLRTGDEVDMVGERPGFGVDIEPLGTGEPSYGLTFDDCDFDDNQGSSNENGNRVSQGAGRGFNTDTHSDQHYLNVTNCRARNNRTEAFKMNVREGASFVHALMEDIVGSGNGINQILFDVGGSGTSPATRLTDVILDNCDISALVFDPSLPSSGHTVTIYKNSENHPPTVTTNGIQTITLNNGSRP